MVKVLVCKGTNAKSVSPRPPPTPQQTTVTQKLPLAWTLIKELVNGWYVDISMFVQSALLPRMANGHVQVMFRGVSFHKTAPFSLRHYRCGMPFVEQEAFAHTGGGPDTHLKEDITINLSLDSIAPSPINVDALESELSSYNSPDAAIILDGLRNCFKINYEGPHEPTESKNIKSENQHPEIVHQKIKKELRMGRIAGPFDQRPLPTLRASPIGLVPKKQEPNEF